MSREYIPIALRRSVIERASGVCEYCLLHEDDTGYTHPIDHVIAVKHGGTNDFDNLALSCVDCNRHKGSDLFSIDPLTGNITPLYNPRTQEWFSHFELDGARIIGQTDVGRTTVILLRLNDPNRLIHRETLLLVERYPILG